MELREENSFCEKTTRKQDKELVTSVSSKHGLCFHAPPRRSRQESVYFRLFVTTGYCYWFICLYGKHICATCGLSLWLYTVFRDFFLTLNRHHRALTSKPSLRCSPKDEAWWNHLNRECNKENYPRTQFKRLLSFVHLVRGGGSRKVTKAKLKGSWHTD